MMQQSCVSGSFDFLAARPFGSLQRPLFFPPGAFFASSSSSLFSFRSRARETAPFSRRAHRPQFHFGRRSRAVSTKERTRIEVVREKEKEKEKGGSLVSARLDSIKQ